MSVPDNYKLLYTTNDIQREVKRVGTAVSVWANAIFEDTGQDVIGVPVLRGGIFFFAGMYIIIKSGSLNLKRKNHRWWVKILFGGYFFFMSLHALLIIAALYL